LERVAQEDLKTVVDDKGVETTQEETEGYFIIKSILRRRLESGRIVGRDTKTYFGVLLDDNNRKPLCRLWFNGSKKFLGLFDNEKNETKHEIHNLDEIFNFQEQLLKGVDFYEKDQSAASSIH
jgi:predicted type IV restriction endonuclease